MKYVLMFCGLFLFVGTASATSPVPHHYHYGNWNYKECIQTKCGCASGTQDRYKVCNDYQNGWGSGGCVFGNVITENVSCEVKEPTQCEPEIICETKCGIEEASGPDGQGGTKTCPATNKCEEEGVCPTTCGLEASEVADGQGGTKVCEATQKCEVPKKEKTRRPDLDFTQGPGGKIGDGKVKLRWKDFEDCSKVKIKISNTKVFGKDYQIFKEKDDGSEWMYATKTFWAKIKCSKDGSKWSEVEKINP